MSYFKQIEMSRYLADLSKQFGSELPLPLVANDDGYDQQNLAYWMIKDGELTIGEDKIKSRAKRGRQASALDMGASGLFSSEGVDYTVSESLDYEDTRSDEYPKTILNRILVHAGLNSIGLSDATPVAVVTGLPLKEYAPRMGEINTSLIDDKAKNMMQPVTVGSARQPSARVCFHGTYPEAIAGIADYLIDNKGQLREGLDPAAVRMALDIGGKTTDMAVIINGRDGMQIAAMQTIDMGVSNIRDILSGLVEDRVGFRLDQILRDQALNERIVEAFDESHDVADLWEQAVTEVFSQIFAEADKMRRKHPSIKELVCFGGGAALGEEVIRAKFPSVKMVENPDGANARGFLKFATTTELEQILAKVLAYFEEHNLAAPKAVEVSGTEDAPAQEAEA
ncbi:ParM/StbA family protein [Marinimicrobium sp. ABcell2]|uniref:ParM/StbA family protein n=1 Tax=Marinimicrobium sp. ABcell2 TaxID=3069751 RepID=UPI0027B1812A|nr:ParM/StbA family protein [Marinimicrobium sp. ABcell2]MDQ2077519.1 ParM/StbA family protein [Marinimicrobium sp. ABcell2]